MSEEQPHALELIESLGDPVVFGRELKHRIQSAYAYLAERRGAVQRPEDVFDMVRRIGREYDQIKAYNRAFAESVKLLAQLLEEELVEAVGEQEGIPNQGLTVPDAEGDIRITLDTPKVYEIDMEQVVAVFAALYPLGLPDGFPDGSNADLDQLVTGLVHDTVELLTSLGKFEPQVSKVKAYAATLARNGYDQQASVVTSAITSKTPYKGVKFGRKSPE